MYAKIFASLYQGTLRGCPDEILVFTNMLATADLTGLVDKHPRAIAEETGISRERVDVAIANLMAPDPESRSPELEGRRIIPMDEHRAWGWQIVNHGKYRSIRSEDDRREANRIAQEKFRNKNKAPEKIVSISKPPSSASKHPSAQSAHTEAEAEAEADTGSAAESKAVGEQKPTRFQEKALPKEWELFATRERPELNPAGVFEQFKDYWAAVPGVKGRKLDWFATWRNWVRTQKTTGGKGNGKFDPHAYSRGKLAQELAAQALGDSVVPPVRNDVPREVHQLISKPRDD